MNKKGDISGSAVSILDHLFLSCSFVVPTLPTMQFSRRVTSLEAVYQIRPVNTLVELPFKAKGEVRKYFFGSN